MELTTEIVRELLDYDQETGIFVWKVRERKWFKSEQGFKLFHTRYAGTTAGTMWTSETGYQKLQIRVLGKSWRSHRLAFLWMDKALPEQVDHLNRDSTDNRWENLAASSAKENMKNKSMFSNNTSGVTGVSWCKAIGKWRALVRLDGTLKYLGYFEDLHRAKEVVEAFREANGFSAGHGKELAVYLDNTSS